MALRLWMGPSGSGKTRFLFEYVLAEAGKHRDRNYLVIVPEQFTLSTQKELIRLSKDYGILNVDVLSFARLSYRIFEEVGFKDAKGKNIDDMGKNLILRHLANKCAEDLTVLYGNMDKLGYITEVKSVISEFMQYGIDVNKLSSVIDDAKKAGRIQLAKKLKDIEVLYNEFNKYTEEKYITKEEILARAAKAAYKSNKLKKSVVVFDGFTGFTPVQYDLIETLLQISHDIHVTILTDTRDKITYNTEHELFYLGYKTADKLKKIAKLNNIPIENDYKIIEDVPRRFLVDKSNNNTKNVTCSELIHLEKNLFREYGTSYKTSNLQTDGCKLPTQVVNSGVCVFSGVQPIDEITKVAIEIQKLIRNEAIIEEQDLSNNKIAYDSNGIRFKNIAIATGDLETYVPVIRRVFSKYDIPFFIDKKQPVLLNPFIEFVRALVDTITENFSYSAIFRLLRSPILGYERNDIDRLENFVLKYGIKGVKSWCTDWMKKYNRYLKNTSNKDENTSDSELIFMEEMRIKVTSDLEDILNYVTGDDFIDAKKSTQTVNTANAVFMRVFERLNVEKKLILLVEKHSVTDDTFETSHKKEYEKVYDSVIELMLRMEELLEGEKISIKEYGELLDAGFDEIRIGIIPSITDYIQIGDLTRSRFENIHTLFIVGANDGVIPKNSSNGGIISDIEKEYLISNTPDIELSPTVREQAYTGQLYLYMLMTKPTHKLVVSYSRLNNSGESIRPSYIIKVLSDMFPCVLDRNDSENMIDRIYNIDSCLDVIADNLRGPEVETIISTIVNACSNDENSTYHEDVTNSLYKMVDAAFLTGALMGGDSISKAVAEVLYGKAIIGSVTRLEQYARCSFSYFLKYGLSLKEREIFNFEAKDMGSVFHNVLEKYSGYISKLSLNWTDISESRREELVKKAVSECLEAPEYSILSSSFRYKYMVERITRISMRSVETLTNHLRSGDFVPKDAEISFQSTNNLDAFTFKLSDDEIMRLTGTIDRLDTYEDSENNRIYIKVIDYKSGDKALDLIEIYKGLSLQLVVYMNAAMEITKNIPENSGKEILPAGILYYHIDDPIVEGELSDSNDVISEKIYRELKMKGLVNAEKEVYQLIDKDLDKTSDIIPVSLTSKGEITKTSSVATGEQFGILSAYVNKKITDIGREILAGNIKAEPHGAKDGDTTACEYCQYADICKFDESKAKLSSSSQDNINKDNVIEFMTKALSTGRGEDV